MHSGEVATKTDVEELIREYSLKTTTTFAVWRTEKKNFGSTGTMYDSLTVFFL